MCFRERTYHLVLAHLVEPFVLIQYLSQSLNMKTTVSPANVNASVKMKVNIW